VQPVAVSDGAAGPGFTLSFEEETTDPLTYDATAQEVEEALEALPSIGSGNVSVSGDAGGPWSITFTGALSGTNVPELSAAPILSGVRELLHTLAYAFDAVGQLLSAEDNDSAFVYG
jgi:hypothetical protein